jgi:hypothetical protein
MKASCPPTGIPTGEHVMGPHSARYDRNGARRSDHRAISVQSLARESRNDLGNDAERRQHEDIDLGVAEEPEDVLEQHRVPAARRVEEVRIEVTVG